MVNWDALSPPRAGLRVVVVMPVRDLAARLPAALAALAVQTEFDGRRLDPASFEIVVLANNCSDTSAACARRFATLHPELCLHVVEVQIGRAHV